MTKPLVKTMEIHRFFLSQSVKLISYFLIIMQAQNISHVMGTASLNTRKVHNDQFSHHPRKANKLKTEAEEIQIIDYRVKEAH